MAETGPTGPAGETGPTGPQAAAPEDIFASFIDFAERFIDGNQLTLVPSITDPTGNIGETDLTHVSLKAGYYLVSYSVSAVLRDPGYMQITPVYNGSAHLETGIYFATNTDGSSANGSAHFILEAPGDTLFSLTYDSPETAVEGDSEPDISET